MTSRSAKHRPNLEVPDEQIPSGYRWPGNRLSYGDTKRLIYVANKTNKPINQIIKEAVVEYTTLMIARLEAEAADNQAP